MVEANIPLLIGLDCQKRWGMVIDVDKDTIYLKNSKDTFKMNMKKNHWMLPIQKSNSLQQSKNLVFSVNLDTLEGNKLRKHIVKVHKNLAHKSEDQLLKLFKLAGKDTKDVRKNIKNVAETRDVQNL